MVAEGLTIITRALCGLVPPIATEPLPLDQVTTIALHHSDEPPPDDPHSAHDEAHDFAAGQWRSIQGYYLHTRGYDDIAYHYGIAPDGVVYEGRRLDVRGAATLNANGFSWAVVLLGVDMFTPASEAAFLALWGVLREHRGEHLEVRPHSDFTPTACPGDTLRHWISQLPHEPPEHVSVPPQPPVGPCAALPPGPPPHGLPLLRDGSRGPVVAVVQQRCAELGARPALSWRPGRGWDGIYGPGTEAAVRQVQRDHGVQVDGAVGRQTWCVLGIR